MTSEAAVQIVQSLAKKLSLERLQKEMEKTKDPQLKQGVKEVLSERMGCDECGNDLMYDEDNKEFYCPLGHR